MIVLRSHHRVALVLSLGLLTVGATSCGLAEKAASEAAGAASCAGLDLAGKGLDNTGNLSTESIANLAGVAHAVASVVKELPLDAIPGDAYARIDDAANQLDLASKAYDSDPQGATEVVDRAVGQINGVVADIKDRLDC
jgi:hypothetical protein